MKRCNFYCLLVLAITTNLAIQGQNDRPLTNSSEDGRTIIWSEGFEGSLYNCSFYKDCATDCVWGDVSCESYNGSWSLWCADDGNDAPATNCSHYINDMCSYVQKSYPGIDISNFTNVKLSYFFKFETENNYDFLRLSISQTPNDPNSWIEKRVDSGNSGGYWFQPVISIPDGWQVLYWRFKFESDGSYSNYEGAYIDDMEVTGNLVPAIHVESPNGGESWQAGTTHTITWTDNISENVKIQLDKGGSLSTIVSSTPSDGNYSWVIPSNQPAGTNYKIKITSTSNSSIYDYSNGNFTITPQPPPPYITITSPNGGESWQAGTTHTITWTDNISENVKIELYKGGSYNSTISSSTASDGSYSWDIPTAQQAGTNYQIKITSTSNSSIYDYSNGNFTITPQPPPPYITITSPNGGENWQAGTTHTITWTDNISENVKIELYKGGSYNSTISSSTASDGSYSWNIPTAQQAGTNYQIKITSTSNSSVYDYSNGNFEISAIPPDPFITVTSPNGGENWQAGTTHTITWDDNISENVKIELYKGGSYNSTISSSTASDGSHSWTIPTSQQAGTNYKIKITSTSTSSVYDYSNGNFEISAIPPDPFITVTSPNGGENWQAGTTHTITWDDNISENVKIELYKGGSYNSTISSSTASDGSYSWDIPTAQQAGTNYQIKITSTSNSSVYDYSNGNFEISAIPPDPFITVTSPNGGEIWQAGTTHTITWTDNISENVKIELYKGGSYNSTISSSTASDGSYSWSIPTAQQAGTNYKIKITSTSTSSVYDYSNGNFEISAIPPDPFITVTSPNGGENWQAGTTHTITWDDNISENVKIELLKGSSVDTIINSSTPSNGSYSWTIPPDHQSGTNYKIFIISTTNFGVYDNSNNNFEISPEAPPDNITVTSPNGGEDWQAGTSHTITWTDNISENVKIELDKGGTLSTIISSTPSDGSYSWTIPTSQQAGTNYKIKITSTIYWSTVDESDADFEISIPVSPEITLTSPNGGEIWGVGTTHSITWADNISENVKIELIKNVSIDHIITSSALSNGSYSWTIPSDQEWGTKYKVKISSVSNSTIFDASNTYFEISSINPSYINITSPNGGEIWQTETTQNITWSDNISEDVKIELDMGGILSTIIESTLSNGSYSWSIASDQQPATNYKIKITSTANSSVYDYSDNTFEIRITIVPFLSVLPDEITLDAEAGSWDNIEIISNISWSISNYPSWLDLSSISGSNNANVTVSTNSANNTGLTKMASIKIDGIENVVIPQNVIVKQLPSSGMNDEEGYKFYELWPNPVGEVLFIQSECNKSLNILIINNIGEEVFNKSNLDKETTIDVSALRPGLYFIKLTCDDHNGIQKLVVR